eukprot:CFRG1066T1
MDQSEAIVNFMAISQAAESDARFFLESANWDLEQAIASFYEEEESGGVAAHNEDGTIEDIEDESDGEGETLSRQQNISARGRGSNFPLPDDENDEDWLPDVDDSAISTGRTTRSQEPSASLSEYEMQARRAPISELSSSSGKKKKKSGSGGMRIATLHNMNDESSTDDENNNKYYAGGGKSSGQYVEGPPGQKKKKHMNLGEGDSYGGNSNDEDGDVIKSIFKRAQAEGHAPRHPPGEERTKAARPMFSGLGFALGDETNESPAVPLGESLSSKSNDDETETKNIVFWRNGFTIGDGDLRTYEDPANKEFLEALNKGYAPAELTYGRNMMNVSVVVSDKKELDYVPTKKSMKAFSGQGRALGSPTPNVAGAGDVGVSATPTTSSSSQLVVNVDDSQPVTSVQVRLVDGSRLVAKLNHTHTVGDLRTFINHSSPAASADGYSLILTFPRKELTDESVTLKDANLLNAVVVQQKL